MKFGSLFAGIGGIDLGLERAGMECVWQVENDDYCNRVLEKHWPDVQRFGDVRKCTDLPPVDLISGGFPCQDISHAGNKNGIRVGTRSGLWIEFFRIIRELQPRYVLVENVSALLVWELGRVLGDLAAGGYDAEWQMLPAAAFGAPHIRDRCFIVAYPDSVGRKIRQFSITGRSLSRNRLDTLGQIWKTAKPQMVRMVDGVSPRLDKARLRGLGNAVVPQVAQWIGERILEFDE